MSETDELSVLISGKESGLRSLLNQIESALQKADATAKAAAESIGGGLSTAEQRAANEAIRTAQAIARLDVAEGQAARGSAVLRAALEGNAGASQRVALAAQTQLARMQQLEQGTNRLAQAQKTLAGLAGAAGIALALPQIAQGTAELIKQGGQAELVAKRFDQLAAAAGQSGEALLGALKKASGGQISDLNLQLAANRANLLGVATSAEQLGVLMSIARDRAQTLGTSATEAFNDLVTGLGRGSPLILDNLGIMVDIKGANEAYAASVGKTVAQLSDAEKKQALINQVVADGKAKLLETGGAAETSAASFERLGIAAENAGTRLGVALSQALAPAARGGAIVLDAITAALNRQAEAGTRLADVNSLVAGSANYAEYAAQVQQLSAASGQAYGNIGALTEAQFAQAKAAQGGTTGGQQWADATQQGAVAAQELAAATSPVIQGYIDQAAKSADAAAAAQTLAAFQADVARLADPVARGIISDAGAADLLAAKYGIAADAARALVNEQARVAGGQQRLASQAAQTRDLTNGGIGFNAPGRGRGSDADIINTVRTTQTALDKEEAAGQKKRTATARTGGAGRAATEQKYQQQSLDQERSYQQKLAQIAADGAQKRIEAEKKYTQASLDSRADFYAGLADEKDQGLAQQLSAQYEEAAAKAAEIARTQGADAAEAYLSAAQQAINKEAETRRAIAEEQAKGGEADQNKIEYLQGVLKLQQDADNNRLKQIQESGSALAAEQARQYADAEAQYAQHLDRLDAKAKEKGVTLGQTLLPGGASPQSTLPPPSSAPGPIGGAGATTTTGAQAVQDIATPPAIDAQTSRLEGKLNELVTTMQDVGARVSRVESAIGGLKQSRATAGG